MWKYSEKLMEHFMNPRNVGEIENADGHAEVGSPQCGDAMTLDIVVSDDGTIEEIRFRTFGCAAAIASASAMTEMVKGMSIGAALDVKNSQIADYIDGMPHEKFHCSVMGREALTAAIADFMRKREAVERAAMRLLSDPPGGFPEDLREASVAGAHSDHVVLVSERSLSADSLREMERLLRDILDRQVEVRQAGR